MDVYFSPHYRNRNNKTPMTTFPPGGGGEVLNSSDKRGSGRKLGGVEEMNGFEIS